MDSIDKKVNKHQFTNKKINVIYDFTEIDDNVKRLLKKNEDVIVNYLERFIYTSTISETTHNEILEIFNTIKSKIT